MPTIERIIPPVVADDGSVHYSSVMSPSDDSIAVCPMIPSRIIPVIFVPGIMGTNLMDRTGRRVWRVDSTWSVVKDWGLRGAEKRKTWFDPARTVVDDRGAIPEGTALKEDELRRRGWGEVGEMSYGTFLPWIENALNDFTRAREGTRADLMKEMVAHAPGVDLLTHDEVAMSYRYQFPVHAVGYNWLQSNKDSAKRLEQQIQKFMRHYRDNGFPCSKVIVVTHSMGGLVARWHSEVDNHRGHVLGIVHGVMPATGAATAYKRVKSGTEGAAGIALGANAAEMTAVFAQAPGALQLLPCQDYGMGWLKVSDGQQVKTLPARDPYEEIYLNRGSWWSLCDDKLINPLDERKKSVDKDWAAYETLINKKVKSFHDDVSRKYHGITYAFYGEDEAKLAWGDVIWSRRTAPYYTTRGGMPKMDEPLGGTVISDVGKGDISLKSFSDGKPTLAIFDLQPAAEQGDGTVPARSGRAPSPYAKACVSFADVDHEGAYKELPQRLFALWAITKVAYQVRFTDMAYRS